MLAAGHLIGHSEWTVRKQDVGLFAATIRANSGAPQKKEDDVPYTDWPVSDRQALLDDVWRMLSRGQKIDGTSPPQLTAGSIGKAVELINLVRVGDDPDPATGDTHPGLDTVLRQVTSLAGVVASQGETLAAIAAVVVPADPAPTLGA
jgi:hypothetical protein